MSEFLNSINTAKPPDTSWETEARSFEPDKEPVAPAPEEAPKAEAETSVAATTETQAEAPASPAEPADDVRQVVPLKALQEERRANKELSERLAQIEHMMRQQPQAEQPQDDQGPDPETDPIGALKWERARRIAYEQEMHNQRGMTQLQSVYQSSAREFATKTPDFSEAYNFAINSRAKQLAALGHDNSSIAETIKAEEMHLAATALNNGRNPAEVIYEFAKSYGYTGKAPVAAAPTPAAVAPVVDPAAAATLQKAKAAAATSISSGGKPPKSDFDPASLTELKGAAFDAAWEKMAKQSGSRSSMFRE